MKPTGRQIDDEELLQRRLQSDLEMKPADAGVVQHNLAVGMASDEQPLLEAVAALGSYRQGGAVNGRGRDDVEEEVLEDGTAFGDGEEGDLGLHSRRSLAVPHWGSLLFGTRVRH